MARHTQQIPSIFAFLVLSDASRCLPIMFVDNNQWIACLINLWSTRDFTGVMSNFYHIQLFHQRQIVSSSYSTSLLSQSLDIYLDSPKVLMDKHILLINLAMIASSSYSNVLSSIYVWQASPVRRYINRVDWFRRALLCNNDTYKPKYTIVDEIWKFGVLGSLIRLSLPFYAMSKCVE